jgi:hypothetical protein
MDVSSMLSKYLGLAFCAAFFAPVILPIPSFCQQASSEHPTQPEQISQNADSSQDTSHGREDKRIFGIIPNYRTSPSLKAYKPLTAREKFRIASEDAFDRGTFVLAAAFAGQAQLTNSNPSFGQGVQGYARYFGTASADFIVGDYMTEAIFPTILHQDPRYFRRGTGTGWSRLAYAAGQIFWTHTDSGGSQFNLSEIAGNSAAVAISNIYYPENRTVSSALSKLGAQIGVDMAANILKEFWPDLNRRFSRKHRSTV